MGDSRISGGKYGPLIRQTFVTANVAMTVVGNGCSVGITAILIPGLRAPGSSIHATVQEESWIASAIGIPLFIGNLLVAILPDKLGRKKSHFYSIIPILMSWLMLLLAENVAGLIASRLLQGIAAGFFSPISCIIIGEMTDPKYRGMFLTSISLSLTIGVLVSHALGTVFSWQMTTLICSFTTFSSLLLLFYTPESPSWLISKGRYEEAAEIFFWLRGKGEEQQREFDKMVTAHKQNQLNYKKSEELSLKLKIRRLLKYSKETIKKPEFFKPLIIMIFMYIMSQFAGIHVISTYAMDIIEEVVGREANKELLMVLLDIERLICNIVAVYLMKIAKRRTLLFSTGVGCILAYFGKAGYVYLRRHDMMPYDSQWIPMGLIAIYMFTVTVGVCSVPFAIAGEIFPLEYRGLGSGVSNVVLSLIFFIAVKCFPVLCISIGISGTYVLYGSMVAVSLLIVWFLLPETKDRTLQDIEDEFRGFTSEDMKCNVPLKSQPEGGEV